MSETVVTLKPRLPKRLRDLARERGIEPAELVAEAVRNSFTLADAAESLGVTHETFRSWRRLTGITVTSGGA